MPECGFHVRYKFDLSEFEHGNVEGEIIIFCVGIQSPLELLTHNIASLGHYA